MNRRSWLLMALVQVVIPFLLITYGEQHVASSLSEPITAGAILGLVLILVGSWIAAEGRLPGQARATTVAPLEPPPARDPA